MRFSKTGQIAKLLVAFLSAAALTFLPIKSTAAANHSDGYVSADFGGINIAKSESLEARFMPINIDGLIQGAEDRWTHFYHLDLTIDSGDPNNPINSFIRFGSYRKVGNTVFGNLDFYVRGATQVKANAGSNCELDAWGQVEIRKISGTETHRSQCWRGTSLTIGRDYTVSLNPDLQKGDNWWFIKINETDNPNNSIIVGSIKIFGATPDLNIKNMSWSLTYMGDAKPCSEVPSMDTFIWPIKSSSGTHVTYIRNNIGKCINGSFDWSSTKNAWYAQVGGKKVNSNTNLSTNSSTAKRIPRPNNTWTQPQGVLPGLSEVRMKGYFADDPSYFATAQEISRSFTKSNSLPIWDVNYEFPTFTSAWWGGYFIPDESGNWEFQLTSDDASYLWIGKSAITEYSVRIGSAFLSLPGAHPKASTSGAIYLEKDKIYPIRIQYGNAIDASSFKLEVKAPSFKSNWDSNLEGLIWSSDYTNMEDCTNFGISYSLAQSLGYGTFDVPGCKNNPAKSLSGSSNSGGNSTPTKSSSKTKPNTPTFSAVNFSDNKFNIEVNIGNSGTNPPDKIYLVAPKMGITSANPIFGKINGEKATWSLELSELLSGVMIPLEIVSEKDGVSSDALTGVYQAPYISTNGIATSAPLAPSNFKSRIVGNSALITVELKNKRGAIPTNAYLYSKSLGIPKNKAIQGDIIASNALIEVPLKSSMLGNKYSVIIYLSNGKGESTPLSAILSVPKAPTKPTIPTAAPSAPKAPLKSAICVRSNQTRTFTGDTCPPGWTKR